MNADLRSCCQQAELDGISPRDHFEVCDARAGDPETPALFDLPDQPERGGQLL